MGKDLQSWVMAIFGCWMSFASYDQDGLVSFVG